MKLVLFSGGAAKAVVTGLQAAFESSSGCTIEATFDAVGAMRDRVLAGAPCDVLVLSQTLIDQLGRQAVVITDSARALGHVATGIAVREGAPPVAVGDASELHKTLLASSGLYVPDMKQSTAGIHIAAMLRSLGLDAVLADRIHEYPNGATAMRALADSGDDGMIGCTQVTEIMYTQGVRLIADLPAEFALSTVYAAAVCSESAQPTLARAFVDRLASEQSSGLRRRAGFA
ncbi:substrate-binding domain-containing protein [soil metagenome]